MALSVLPERRGAVAWAIVAAVVGAGVLAVLGPPLSWASPIVLFLPLLVLFRFRDPDRVSPTDVGAVLAPCDGVVDEIDCVTLRVRTRGFDVAVLRTPVSGRLERLVEERTAGAAPGVLDRVSLTFSTEAGPVTVRHEGRGVRTPVEAGVRCPAGTRSGSLRGPTVTELQLPEGPGRVWAVGVGDRVRAGETLLANLSASDVDPA